jgi:hypothetical protein
MARNQIEVRYQDFKGVLAPYTPADPPISYFVMEYDNDGKSFWVNGFFNRMSTGWIYYPNAKGYNYEGFETYLISSVLQVLYSF